MGKKRVIQKSQDELLAEREKVERKMNKEVAVKTPESVKKGSIYISSSYNNTIITLTNQQGDVLFWRSAGSIGFKGTKKGTSFAASKVAEAVASVCRQMKINEVNVFLKGVGGGRDSALKTIVGHGLKLNKIKDITPIPHNGCRPKKPRRV